MPKWDFPLDRHISFPKAEDAAQWEQVCPGLAATMLKEAMRTRRHARAWRWASLALGSAPTLARVFGVVGIWQIVEDLPVRNSITTITAVTAIVALGAAGRRREDAARR